MPIPEKNMWLVTVVAIIGKFFITMAYSIIYFYTNELFPTVIRATGMGTSNMISRDYARESNISYEHSYGARSK